MKLSVIIVNYNVRYYLAQCIASVLRATEGMEAEVIVVDNDSKDDSVAYIRERFADRIRIIESSRNLGFAGANNIGIRESKGEYVLLLNPDTFVAENTLRDVVGFMDAHERCGAAGARMHNADGTLAPESRRAIPSPIVSFMKMLGFTNRYYMSHLPWTEAARMEVVSGAFCMLRRKALDEVGLLSEDFFMYGEDIDLSYRILKGGWENWYVPADIVHYKGESTHKTSFRYVHVFYQAMLIFFRKHYGHLSMLVSLPIKLAIYSKAFLALCQMLLQRMRKSLGFSHSMSMESPIFCLADRTSMKESLQQLCARNGIEVVSSSKAGGDIDYIVYDTDTYDYADIISDAASHGQHHPKIATYYPEQDVMITPEEIIR